MTIKLTRSIGPTLEHIVYASDAFPERRLLCMRFYGQTFWSAVGLEADQRIACQGPVQGKFNRHELDSLAQRWIEFGLPYL